MHVQAARSVGTNAFYLRLGVRVYSGAAEGRQVLAGILQRGGRGIIKRFREGTDVESGMYR